jgi:hypothetical protein
MFGPNYNRMRPAALVETYRGWQSELEEWLDFASQFATDRRACRAARRGIRRCQRKANAAKAAARRRGIRL